MKYIIIVIIIIIVSTCHDKEVGYFKNGKLKYSVPLKNNRREGQMREYSSDGSLLALADWKEGKQEGMATDFHSNGQRSFVSKFLNGKIIDSSYYYNPKGELREIQIFSRQGKLIDFIKYKDKNVLDLSYRRAVFETEKDTININEYFNAKIRLGNRKYQKIKVITGEISKFNKYENDFVNDTTRKELENIDSLTAIIKLQGTKRGINYIEGAIYDIYESKNKDTLIYRGIPFRHKYYVK